MKGMERATVDLAVASGCRIAVPQHHDPLFEGAVRPDLTELKRLFSETKIVFQELVPGKWYESDSESTHLLPALIDIIPATILIVSTFGFHARAVSCRK